MVSYKKYSDIEVFEGNVSEHQYPWHFHDCYTLIAVEEGSIVYEFQDQNLRIDEAEALIVEPGKIHRNTISQPTAYRAFFLSKEYFEFEGQKAPVTRKVIHPGAVEIILELLRTIELNSRKDEIKEVAFELCELMNQSRVETNDEFPSGINAIPTIDLELTINELAEKAHLSKFHFQRKFKKEYGLTVGQLKQQEKTNLAKTLLESGKLPTDIAHELGFFDQSHFIKYFKKMWAVTPKNFK